MYSTINESEKLAAGPTYILQRSGSAWTCPAPVPLRQSSPGKRISMHDKNIPGGSHAVIGGTSLESSRQATECPVPARNGTADARIAPTFWPNISRPKMKTRSINLTKPSKIVIRACGCGTCQDVVVLSKLKGRFEMRSGLSRPNRIRVFRAPPGGTRILVGRPLIMLIVFFRYFRCNY